MHLINVVNCEKKTAESLEPSSLLSVALSRSIDLTLSLSLSLSRTCIRSHLHGLLCITLPAKMLLGTIDQPNMHKVELVLKVLLKALGGVVMLAALGVVRIGIFTDQAHVLGELSLVGVHVALDIARDHVEIKGQWCADFWCWECVFGVILDRGSGALTWRGCHALEKVGAKLHFFLGRPLAVATVSG
jgi:hypothetical protein